MWSRKEAYNQTEFALGVAISVLRYYEEFFDIPYPLPKQGQLWYTLLYVRNVSCSSHLVFTMYCLYATRSGEISHMYAYGNISRNTSLKYVFD